MNTDKRMPCGLAFEFAGLEWLSIKLLEVLIIHDQSQEPSRAIAISAASTAQKCNESFC